MLSAGECGWHMKQGCVIIGMAISVLPAEHTIRLEEYAYPSVHLSRVSRGCSEKHVNNRAEFVYGGQTKDRSVFDIDMGQRECPTPIPVPREREGEGKCSHFYCVLGFSTLALLVWFPFILLHIPHHHDFTFSFRFIRVHRVRVV